MSSSVLKKSAGSRAQLSLLPTDVVLVCGPREECDPFILKLGDEGFLRLRHTTNRRMATYDDGAGTIVPDRAFIDGIKKHGVLQAVRIMRDGEDYLPPMGRKRIKSCAILNYEASQEAGERIEKYRFGAVVFTGTEQQAYEAMVIENNHRMDDPPTLRAEKIRMGLDIYNLEMDVVCGLFNMTESNVRLALQLLSLSAEMRALVDSHKVKSTLAARKYSRLPREEQFPTYERLASFGIYGGARAEDALDRILSGLPITEPDDASADDDSSDGSEDGGAANGADDGDSDTEKAAAKPSKPKVDRPASFVRNPSRQVVQVWERTLMAAAKAPVPDVPEKYKSAIDAAFAKGAAMMAGRFLNKEPPGWKKHVVPMLEPKEES